ncbi:MAG TPA: hypothetical protein VLX28_14420 [Thermoanaerobaculia bacterium]|nr:hypothetical protein [Thermoanaerobaculia bacterium]
MGSTGLVTLKEIKKMLDGCAPGATIDFKPHKTWVHWNGRTYWGLPRGAHGARENPEIEIGHVKKMARFFEILDCAKKYLNLK